MIQFLKFGVVGAIGTLINMTVFEALRFAGLHYLASSSVSFLVAATGNYLLNRRWTFKASRDSFSSWMLYVLVNLVGLASNLAVLSSLTEWAGWPVSVSQLCGIGAGMVFNFLLSRALVFRPRGDAAPKTEDLEQSEGAKESEKGDGWKEPSPGLM